MHMKKHMEGCNRYYQEFSQDLLIEKNPELRSEFQKIMRKPYAQHKHIALEYRGLFDGNAS